ncbi:MAG: hypothetical protein AAB518_04205 [Patescibacteria group bacterium]
MDIFKAIAAAVFLAVQVFTVVMFFIIRFHFKNFTAPGDYHAKTIVLGFGLGTLLLIGITTFIFLNVIL